MAGDRLGRSRLGGLEADTSITLDHCVLHLSVRKNGTASGTSFCSLLRDIGPTATNRNADLPISMT